MEEQKRRLKGGIAGRIKVFYGLFTLIAILFAVRIAWIQIDQTAGRHLDTLKSNYIVKMERVPAHRGSIYSRNGEVMATSITHKELRMDFGSEAFDKMERYRRDADTLSHQLANFFGDKSAKAYYDELIAWRRKAIVHGQRVDTIKPKWYQFWKRDSIRTRQVVVARKHISRKIFRNITLDEWEKVRHFHLLKGGLDVTYTAKDHEYRVYPQGEIALRTIGRNEPEVGRQYGIEFALHDTLAGRDGQQLMQTIAAGYRTRVISNENIDPQDGYDIVTTLDIDVQDVADKALRDQLIKQNAEWGTTIVMECATGDILAIANLGRDSKRALYERKNYAIGTPVNPGSTFKLISAMALLEEGVPTSLRYNSGLGKRIKVGGDVGAWVQDSHAISRETNGVIDMRRAFAESANVYFTKVVFDTFKENTVAFSDFCRKLHLHESVGLEYLGARKGVIPHLSRKHHSRYNALVNMAYGYGLEITPLHTLAVYNAVANNGKMVAPRLILRIERNGECVHKCEPRIIEEKICSQSTLDTLRSFMEEVSLSGTAVEYFGEKRCSFRTGAKTGTAQVDSEIDKVRYRRGDGYYYGSMVTYLPADNPRYTIITAIFTKRQKGKFYYGASLAGPVQQSVATFLHNRDKRYAEEVADGDFYSSNIKSGNIDNMRKVASECGGDFTAESRHGWGKSAHNGDGRLIISQLETESGCVPDVVGMGLDDALYLLEKSGMRVDIKGAGRVVRQSIAAGCEVSKTGGKIEIVLE